MLKNGRKAIELFGNNTNTYGRYNEKNAFLQHLQFLASKSKDVTDFAKKKKKFFKNLDAKTRLKSSDTKLFNYAVQFFAAQIVAKLDVAKEGLLKKLISDFKKHYTKELDRKEAEAYKKGKKAIDKASKSDGKKLAGPRKSKELSKDGSHEPMMVKQETKPEARWTIKFKDIEGIDDATLNAKELFKNTLAGAKGSLLKVGMKEDDENKLRVAAIQQKLKVPITGKYDNKTKTAVEKFQTENKLTKDGKIGRQTITAFFSDTAKGIAKNIPITGKDVDEIITKTIDNLTKDQDKTFITPDGNREVKLDDKKQRGLEERRLFENQLKSILQNYVRNLNI